MILCFDIGNTTTKMGLFRRDSIVPLIVFRFPTAAASTPDSLHGTIENLLSSAHYSSLKEQGISGIGISSVVKEVNDVFRKMAAHYYSIEPLIITHAACKDIKIDYERPEMLGPDRIANAVAAHRLYGNDCLIIDLGTATTFTVLREGSLIGGIIAPGVETAAKSLLANTSMLVDVPISPPVSVIGKNTQDCIRSGLFYGWLSMIKGLVVKIFQNKNIQFPIVVTGGHAKTFAGHFEFPCTIDPLLTLKGVRAMWG